VTGGSTLTFDVARFLTGKAAADAATAHGDESPPPNDYYIVNDVKKLSTYLVSTSVVVRYIPMTACCNLKPGNFSAWSEAVNGTAMTDYPGKNAPWWITIKGGSVVKIEQQFLP
jgi:quinol-cytochrome oxidoreductase complex cytochrome b subunit